MINIYVVLAILIIHWFADFVLQTDWMALNKSHDNEALVAHVSVYSLVWLIVVWGYLGLWQGFTFFFITFILHFCTDYLTSRLNSYLWLKENRHWFFVSIGFDQILHYVQLLLTYMILIK